MTNNIKLALNNGGPLHYLGNRYLCLPDLSGHMAVDHSWLLEFFSIILANKRSAKKYRKCFEPFAGSASWSLAAMELQIAEEYIINDSDNILINTHRLIRDKPDKIKESYAALTIEFRKSSCKKSFFKDSIQNYNKSGDNQKSLLLPFIINHSWGGIIFHDDKCNIIYRENKINGEIVPGYLEEPNLSLDLYFSEVDRASMLFNSNKVEFQSGDFSQALSDIQSDDFVALNPPYPENERLPAEKIGVYTELYSPEILHEKLTSTIRQLELRDIDYYMTYGFYNPKTKNFVLRDQTNQLTHYFRVLGYPGCAFGMALDQVYFNTKFSIPKELGTKLLRASDILGDQERTPEEALKCFLQSQAGSRGDPIVPR